MTQQSTGEVVQPVAPQTETPAAEASDAAAGAEPEEVGAVRSSAQLVPVTESIRYRRRAQQAEQNAARLQQELDQQQRTRTELESQLSAARRRNELMQRLADRGVIDLEAALLLAEQRLADRTDTPDHQAVVEQLLKEKPYLVAPKAGDAAVPAPSAALGTPTQGRRPRTGGLDLLRSAAQRASGTGRGAELENYLRLRRRVK